MNEIKEVIHLDFNIDPFKTSWGTWCKPIQYEDGYYLPIGWEEELIKKSIEFDIREIEIQNNIAL
jgi:hypothetical protein